MIVPTNRLLILAALLTPFFALAAFSPELTSLVYLLAAAAALVALFDAYISRNRLAEATVELPALLRLTKGREGSLGVRIHHPSGRLRRVRLGLPWPRGVDSPQREMTVDLPRSAAESRVDWPCRGRRRGRFQVAACHVEAPSYLGLWAWRQARPVRLEVRVYPNLFTEKRGLAALFLNRGQTGVHVRRQVGKGREFEQLRDYLPGDSYEDIHWKATAKRGQPVTKMYQIERTQEVYVVLDASRLSGRPGRRAESPEDSLCERYLTAALVLALAAERQGDRFGLLAFTDQVVRFVRAGGGRAHYNACRESLYTLTPKRVSPDFAETFAFIGARLRKRALLLFLTHLDDPVLAEQFAQNAPIISRRHLTVAGMIKPALARPVFSQAEVDRVEGVYEALAGHFIWRNLNDAERRLKEKNVDLALFKDEHLAADLISLYMNVKKRQAL